MRDRIDADELRAALDQWDGGDWVSAEGSALLVNAARAYLRDVLDVNGKPDGKAVAK